MKFNFNVVMTIWCASWVLYSLFFLFIVSSWQLILMHLLYIATQSMFGVYYAKNAKEPFRNFYAKIKEILKK